LVSNKLDAAKCVCCEAPNPKAPAAAAPSIWTQAAEGWQCRTCLVNNKKDAAKCVCCEAPNPSAPEGAAAPGGGGASVAPAAAPAFTFGFGASATAAAPLPTTATGGFVFNFGAGATAAAPTAAASGAPALVFNFGAAVPAAGAGGGGGSGAAAGALVTAAGAKASTKSATAEAALALITEELRGLPAPAVLPRYEITVPGSGASPFGVVFTFGTGDCDQLGHDDEEFTQLKPRLVKALQGVEVTRIAVGGMHTVALTRQGRVYTWGCNDDSALGRSGKENCPELVGDDLADVFVVQIACGDSHSGVLDDRGRVFTWGTYKGSAGHLGYTAETRKQATPKLMDKLLRVRSIKCGANHTAVVTDRGAVLSWGYSEQGQLGKALVTLELRGNRSNGVALTPYPLRVTTLEPAGAAAGAGAGPDFVSPRRRRRQEEVAEVFCGGYCTVILTTTSRVRASL
jgi:hypothetical protein